MLPHRVLNVLERVQRSMWLQIVKGTNLGPQMDCAQSADVYRPRLDPAVCPEEYQESILGCDTAEGHRLPKLTREPQHIDQ